MVVPRLGVEGLYLVATRGAGAVAGGEGRVAERFLSALGLVGYGGGLEEFKAELASRLLEGLGEALASVPGEVSLTPRVLAEAAGRRGVRVSLTSAARLLRLLAELGVVVRFRSWAVYAPGVEEAVLAYLRARGEARVAELEERFGPGTREAVARLWAAGRVEVVGDPRGPLPGPLGVPRELVARWGVEIPASEVEGETPRLVKTFDRRTGEARYELLIRGDDRVVLRIGPREG